MSTPIVTPNLLAQMRAAQAPMPALPAAPLMPSAMTLPVPAAPLVSKIPNTMDIDQQRVNDMHTKGAGVDQIQNPLLRGIARAGDIAASVFLPGIARSIPGTTLHHQVEMGRAQANLANDQATQKAVDADAQSQAATAREQAQTDYTKQRPEIEQAKIQQKRDVANNRNAATLAPHGFIYSTDPETGEPTITEDPSSQAYKDRQTLTAMHQATADKDQITAEIAQNHYIPGTKEYAEAQKKLQQIDERMKISLASLGVQRERVGISAANHNLAEEKFYNPQPTAAERGKGDLAQSALERVSEMKQIVSKHPEWFGPGSGRLTNVKIAIGNQDPDMQTFLSASQYLSDHSAGVFGGRGKYITEKLHGLTDPHSNPAALTAALDEAEKAAQGFVKAGAVHGKGQSSGYSSGNADPLGIR